MGMRRTIDGGPQYGKLFRQAVAENVRDYAQANDPPRPGFFIIKLHKRAPPVPARIYLCDHEPGEPDNKLDTGSILMAEIAGRNADPLDVWCAAGGRRDMTPKELAAVTWGRQYEAPDPRHNPHKAVDLAEQPPLFPEE